MERWSRDRSSLEGAVPNFKGASKYNVISRSPALAKLNLECHMNYSIISSPVGSLCHTPGVVLRVSSVSTITTRNNEAIESICRANVYHVPGLCLLGIGGVTYINNKIMA